MKWLLLFGCFIEIKTQDQLIHQNNTTKMEANHIYNQDIYFSRKQFYVEQKEADLENMFFVHFFIYFNLGVSFESIYPDILKIENIDFKLTFNLKLHVFIKEALMNIGPELCKTINIDMRV